MKQPLKYPNGDFTWAELATCNGTNKPGVWQRFDEAKRNKTIVQAGERPQADGRKGKPEKLWRLVAGQPVPVAAVTAPTPATAPTEVKPTPVVPTEAVVVPAAQAIWTGSRPSPGMKARKTTWISRKPEGSWMRIITAWKKPKSASLNTWRCAN